MLYYFSLGFDISYFKYIYSKILISELILI